MTVATVFLGGVLLFVGFFTLAIVAGGLLVYLVAAKLYTFITGDTDPNKFFRTLPVIGPIFANFDHAGTNGEAVKIPTEQEQDEAANNESVANTD